MILIVALIALVYTSVGMFSGKFTRTVAVTVTSDRSGLVMESGSKVKFHGVEVGQVAEVAGGGQLVRLRLDLNPDAVTIMPANIEARIRASTAFGAKYVDLVNPADPSPSPLRAGAVIHSRNVSTEVNTVFENLTLLLKAVDPAKLNAVLAALAEGVRGKGQRIGEATSDANDVLLAINPRMDTVQQGFRSLAGFSDTYSAAADDLLATLSAASTTSVTIADRQAALDSLLLSVIGLSRSGTALLAPNEDNLVRAVNSLEPTTNLLLQYNPVYTCLLTGIDWLLNTAGGYDVTGGANGKSLILDVGILLGDDQYRYPRNLPVVAAQGGPDGKPGCGSLPRADLNFPVRQLVTNTGWGTQPDEIRTHPGLGHPWWINYFPVTRAEPGPPSVRGAR
ncbi:MCE family protein [Rhodococcus erythropolis]|uniref:MCE family protein n=1 Tax=Rhodococcus erythropolis TaxID=1833 RepID=UPI0021BF91A7|nr:MCE family protein [Rhodococcus erythropolis]